MRKIPIGHNAAIAVCSRAPVHGHGLIIVDGKMINACTNFDVSCHVEDGTHIEIGSDVVGNDLYRGCLLNDEELECAKTLMMMVPTKYLVEELEKREGVSSDTAAADEQLDITDIDGPAKVLIITD